jgi:hypothetical protein
VSGSPANPLLECQQQRFDIGRTSPESGMMYEIWCESSRRAAYSLDSEGYFRVRSGSVNCSVESRSCRWRLWLGLERAWSSCIIQGEIRARPAEFCRRKKIPPPSSLDGRVGRRSPSGARNTLASCKLNARNARAVVLPSPRNPAEKFVEKQRALVVLL